jgi:hypothetical protein
VLGAVVHGRGAGGSPAPTSRFVEERRRPIHPKRVKIPVAHAHGRCALTDVLIRLLRMTEGSVRPELGNGEARRGTPSVQTDLLQTLLEVTRSRTGGKQGTGSAPWRAGASTTSGVLCDEREGASREIEERSEHQPGDPGRDPLQHQQA